MVRALRLARWATAVALSAVAAGFVVLFAQALSEVLADPELSLVDGYWIGRLPWIDVGVYLVVIGATIAVVSGTLTAWLAGGAIRRVVSAIALAVAAFWWYFMALPPPPGGAPCVLCPPRESDPMAMAYSVPQDTALFLLLPAAVAGALALSAPRTRRSRVASEAVV